jgi:hypothetical protein
MLSPGNTLRWLPYSPTTLLYPHPRLADLTDSPLLYRCRFRRMRPCCPLTWFLAVRQVLTGASTLAMTS